VQKTEEMVETIGIEPTTSSLPAKQDTFS